MNTQVQWHQRRSYEHMYRQSQRESEQLWACLYTDAGAGNDNYPAAALQGPGLQFLTVPSLCLCAQQECEKVK